MIDSHGHLNDPKLFPEIDALLERAKKAGVSQIIVPGYDLETSAKAIDISNDYEDCYATVGIHPHNANFYNLEMEETLKEYLSNPKVVAIGEIGLDYHYEGFKKEVQKEVFIRQLNLARANDLPVVIHSRDATKDTMDILKEHAVGLSGVLHCFSGSLEVALEYIKELGFYISLGGPVTFKNAKEQKNVAKEVPLNSLLVETDCPYLTPHPHRGKTNEPSYVPYILEEIAFLKGLSKEEVDKVTTKNTRDLFKMKDNKGEGV